MLWLGLDENDNGQSFPVKVLGEWPVDVVAQTFAPNSGLEWGSTIDKEQIYLDVVFEHSG